MIVYYFRNNKVFLLPALGFCPVQALRNGMYELGGVSCVLCPVLSLPFP